jgi:hypothetical protein
VAGTGGASGGGAAARDLAQLGAEGRYFFSLNGYLFLADKPATT